MEMLIAGLRVVCDQGGFKYKMEAIHKIIHMGADHSFLWN